MTIDPTILTNVVSNKSQNFVSWGQILVSWQMHVRIDEGCYTKYDI